MDYSKFRTLRIGQNLTQLECSEKLGVDKKTVQNWEQGKNSISLENADKLLKALGVELTIGCLINERK